MPRPHPPRSDSWFPGHRKTHAASACPCPRQPPHFPNVRRGLSPRSAGKKKAPKAPPAAEKMKLFQRVQPSRGREGGPRPPFSGSSPENWCPGGGDGRVVTLNKNSFHCSPISPNARLMPSGSASLDFPRPPCGLKARGHGVSLPCHRPHGSGGGPGPHGGAGLFVETIHPLPAPL